MNPQSSAALRFGQRTRLTGEPGFDLQSLSTFDLPDGCSVLVNHAPVLPELFVLIKTDNTTPPDGINVIAPVSGPGRWYRYSVLLPGHTVSSVHGENGATIALVDGPASVVLAATPPIVVNATDRVQPFARSFVINAGTAGTVNYAIQAIGSGMFPPVIVIDAVGDECPAGNDRTTTLAAVQRLLAPDTYTFELIANKVGATCTPVCPAVPPALPPNSIINGAQLTVNVYR
jgi:hypothetical protein